MAIDPSGRVAIAGRDGLRAWSPDACPIAFRAHTSPVRAVAFSPDGGATAWASTESVAIFDLATGGLLARIAVDADVTSLAVFDGSGATLATRSGGELVVYSPSDAQPRFLESGVQHAVACGPSGQRRSTVTHPIPRCTDGPLAVVANERRIRVIGLPDGVERDAWFEPAAITGLALGVRGEIIVAGRADGTVTLRDRVDGSLHAEHQFPGGPITAIAIAADARLVAAATADGAVHLWDRMGYGGGLLAVLPGTGAPFQSLAILPDARTLVGRRADGVSRFWSLPDGTAFAEVEDSRAQSRGANDGWRAAGHCGPRSRAVARLRLTARVTRPPVNAGAGGELVVDFENRGDEAIDGPRIEVIAAPAGLRFVPVGMPVRVPAGATATTHLPMVYLDMAGEPRDAVVELRPVDAAGARGEPIQIEVRLTGPVLRLEAHLDIYSDTLLVTAHNTGDASSRPLRVGGSFATVDRTNPYRIEVADRTVPAIPPGASHTVTIDAPIGMFDTDLLDVRIFAQARHWPARKWEVVVGPADFGIRWKRLAGVFGLAAGALGWLGRRHRRAIAGSKASAPTSVTEST